MMPGVTGQTASSRTRLRAYHSWLEALAGSPTTIYRPEPPALVTRVTRRRVTRPVVDQSWAATQAAAGRSQIQIPGLPHQVVTEAVMRLFAHQAEAASQLRSRPGGADLGSG